MVAAGQAVSVVLSYDIGSNAFQTVLTAAVLITTSGRPAAKASHPAVPALLLFHMLHNAL